MIKALRTRSRASASGSHAPATPIDDAARLGRPQPWYGSRDTEAEIAVDIDESESTYYLKADIPGASKDDIDVAIAGDRVTISANVEMVEVEQQGVRRIVRERVHGMRTRRIFLDTDVDAHKAVASFRDGVLSLSLPKKAGARGKSIPID